MKKRSTGRGKRASRGRKLEARRGLKGKAGKPPEDPKDVQPSRRVNTIRGNGALPESMEAAPETVTIGEAIRRAVEQLGDVVIDNSLAPGQMRELAEIYEDITRRQAVHAAKADEAKVAKKSLESVTELLLLKVREFTHPTPLPLFDQVEREGDLGDMLGGGDVGEAGGESANA